MRSLKPLFFGSAIVALVAWAGLSQSQVIPQPGPPVPIGCAFNTVPPTLTNGQAGWVQCDNAGKIITSGGGGGGGAVTVADGADIAEGTTTDGACAGDATSGCTVLARLSRISARLTTILGTGIPVTNANANGQATPTNSSPVVQAGLAYETIAASQTGQALGATGANGDFLSHCVIYPTSTSPGVVTVFDNTSSAANNVIAFPGGASSVSNLVPIAIPVGAFSTSGAWKVTTGANLVVTCYGRFT